MKFEHTPQHPSNLEHTIALAVVVWLMLAGICVLAANAWAMSLIGV